MPRWQNCKSSLHRWLCSHLVALYASSSHLRFEWHQQSMAGTFCVAFDLTKHNRLKRRAWPSSTVQPSPYRQFVVVQSATLDVYQLHCAGLAYDSGDRLNEPQLYCFLLTIACCSDDQLGLARLEQPFDSLCATEPRWSLASPTAGEI